MSFFLHAVDLRLVAPDGTQHVLFSRTGVTSEDRVGYDIGAWGTFVFSDDAPDQPSGGWWQGAAARRVDGFHMSEGTYRTTEPGGPNQSHPAPFTSLDAKFAGRRPSGRWKLVARRLCGGEPAAIEGAKLRLEGQLDLVAPRLTLKKPKVNAKRRSVKLAFRASDDRTARAKLRFSCRLDKKKFRPCGSPVTYRRLKPGRHRITVRATDWAENTAQASRSFKVPKRKAKRK